MESGADTNPDSTRGESLEMLGFYCCKMSEKLLLCARKGQILLQRLYHLKRELADANSDLSFLQDRPFPQLAKGTKHTRTCIMLKI